jgi:hypothetical protein
MICLVALIDYEGKGDLTAFHHMYLKSKSPKASKLSEPLKVSYLNSNAIHSYFNNPNLN